ncbi:MAG: 3-dehydroquinate dehydratase [Aestuariivita sp.]|nr:3-dehydroquinate dehydratase [Aestuariivita sp.]MCY4201077.1 3-dehydroquinate dehydratase [Aestuariivita sp.]MCY4287056.1 3-dehydroquinate dehydratase [Aestuariivita sp.]MCY4345211.1 3-dehydroquinate dehydratase [Aestuariivita sp.]
MKSVLILNGPNLNLLGTRQVEIYGKTTLEQIIERCRHYGRSLGFEVKDAQSNHEGALINFIQAAAEAEPHVVGIILNAGAYTHTSIAIMDAISSVGLPVVEVHLSDIQAREPFRQFSYISRVAIAQICGKGPDGYIEALDILAKHVQSQS